MKQIKTIFSVIILLAGMAMLSGCSEDAAIANDLRGIWRGEIAQDYYSYRWGHSIEYTEVEYEFYDDAYSMRRGTGVEYSYDRRGRGYACGFDYEVRNGDIYLYFDDGADIVITDYRLSNRVFSGYFRDARTGEEIARFTLARVGGYYSNDIYWMPKSEGRQTDYLKRSFYKQHIKVAEKTEQISNK